MAEKLKDGAAKLPAAKVFETLVSRANAMNADMAETRGELGAFVKDAEEKHNIHRKAFKLFLQCDRMDSTKLAEFLRHFDHYRQIGKLNDKAGQDMFAESDADEGKDLRARHLRQNEADRQAEPSNGAERLHGLATVN